MTWRFGRLFACSVSLVFDIEDGREASHMQAVIVYINMRPQSHAVVLLDHCAMLLNRAEVIELMKANMPYLVTT